MSEMNAFRYDGKRVLVVGGATGMGAAAARTAGNLGADVIVMDYAPIELPGVEAVKVDLSDPANLDSALAQIGPVQAIFSAAGIAAGDKTMRVNFIGHRHIIDTMVADGRLGRGGAVCMISSVAGMGWQNHMDTCLEFLGNDTYESAAAWIEDDHPELNHYGFSKQAMNAYVARESFPLMSKGIRINCICPGPTDTPLAQANADTWLTFAQDYRDATGAPQLQPDDMADVMAFLNSDAARGISGVSLLVDSGHVMSSLTGSFEPGKPIVDMILSM